MCIIIGRELSAPSSPNIFVRLSCRFSARSDFCLLHSAFLFRLFTPFPFPLFSCTYELPNFQALCFQILTKWGGCVHPRVTMKAQPLRPMVHIKGGCYEPSPDRLRLDRWHGARQAAAQVTTSQYDNMRTGAGRERRPGKLRAKLFRNRPALSAVRPPGVGRRIAEQSARRNHGGCRFGI